MKQGAQTRSLWQSRPCPPLLHVKVLPTTPLVLAVPDLLLLLQKEWGKKAGLKGSLAPAAA